MQYILSLAALAGVALAQMGDISAGAAPAGCLPTDPNSFQIQTVTTSAKNKRQAPGNPSAGAGQLTITLTDGKLTDSEGRTGYIADNRQFQFDFANGQAGTIYNAGWSVCPNGTLALGPTTVFYQCLSGSFYNLYDQSTGDQCSPINILTIPAGANTGAPATSSAAAPTSSVIATPPPATSSSVPSQIPDGQVQAPPAASQIPDGQIQAPPAASQIPDGQVQAPAASQIPDGQVQAPAAGNATYSAPVPQYTGAASALAPGMGALAAGAIVIALL